MTFDKRTLATLALILVAALAAAIKYWEYLANPWTRNGMVRPAGEAFDHVHPRLTEGRISRPPTDLSAASEVVYSDSSSP